MIQIPTTLVEPLAKRREETGMSTGDLIRVALNNHHADLARLVGGAIDSAVPAPFDDLPAKPSRRQYEDLTSISVRMRDDHWSKIDDLVAAYRAGSRGQLISAALEAELNEA